MPMQYKVSAMTYSVPAASTGEPPLQQPLSQPKPLRATPLSINGWNSEASTDMPTDSERESIMGRSRSNSDEIAPAVSPERVAPMRGLSSTPELWPDVMTCLP